VIIADVVQDAAGYVASIWPLFVAAGFFFVALLAFIRWANRVFHKTLQEQLAPILYEIRPNDGGSIKDTVKRVDDGLCALTAVVHLNASRMTALLSSSESPWFEMDATGQVIAVNDAYCNIYEITTSEALHSLKWRDKIPPEDLARIDASGQRAFEQQSDWEQDFRIAFKGMLVPVAGRSTAVHVNGQFRGWVGVITPDWKAAKAHDDQKPWPPPPSVPWRMHPSAS
jgi:PAS domain S-box-containing protein